MPPTLDFISVKNTNSYKKWFYKGQVVHTCPLACHLYRYLFDTSHCPLASHWYRKEGAYSFLKQFHKTNKREECSCHLQSSLHVRSLSSVAQYCYLTNLKKWQHKIFLNSFQQWIFLSFEMCSSLLCRLWNPVEFWWIYFLPCFCPR